MDTEVNPEQPITGPSVPKRPALRLLGREPQLSRLTTLFPVALSGRAASAMVIGAWRFGKTALLREVTARAREAGFAVATAAGARLERHLNGGVANQLISALTQPLVDDPASPLPHPRLSEARPRGVAEESEALESFYRVVRTAAEQGPVYLGVDNIHLADSWSMHCIAYIQHRVVDLPVLMVFTTLLGAPPHEEVDLREMAGCTPMTVKLTGLGETETAQLLDLAPGELASACCEATGGNPHLLGSLRQRLLPGTDPRSIGSASVGQIMHARMQDVPGASAILNAAAILGEDADFDTLTQLAGVDEFVALEAVDAMARLHLLTNSHTPEISIPFIRNSILTDMPLTTRAVS
ncbi:MAG TPA: AAA family ATPase, partial [Amycolatopsis sp.]|nr:AAA family ATPase [Amycolatopsis sp.]